MSTHAMIAFRLNGKVTGAYTHADGYPSWLGARLVDFVTTHLFCPELVSAFTEKFSSLIPVGHDQKPDAASVRHYLPMARKRAKILSYAAINFISVARMKMGWYALLRDFQGVSMLKGIKSGALRHFIQDDDPLGPEADSSYTYALDLDRGVLEFWSWNSNDETYAKVGEVPFAEATVQAMNAAFKLDEDDEAKSILEPHAEDNSSWLSVA